MAFLAVPPSSSRPFEHIVPAAGQDARDQYQWRTLRRTGEWLWHRCAAWPHWPGSSSDRFVTTHCLQHSGNFPLSYSLVNDVRMGPCVVVRPDVRVGPCVVVRTDVRVGPCVVVCTDVRVGPCVVVRTDVRVGPCVVVRPDVRVGPCVVVRTDVRVGLCVVVRTDVRVGPCVVVRSDGRYVYAMNDRVKLCFTMIIIIIIMDICKGPIPRLKALNYHYCVYTIYVLWYNFMQSIGKFLCPDT